MKTRPSMPPSTASKHSVPTSQQAVAESTERSRLLSQDGPPEVETRPAHYRNIDGTRFWFLFGSVMFGCTIAFFDTTLMASSHPVITSYFDSSNSASWLSTVFYLTSTVSQPLYGRTSDVLGRRPVYMFASIIFLLSTAWCALAQNIGSFIAARAFCGIGAGGVMSIATIILADVVKIEYRGIYRKISPAMVV